MHSIYTQIGNKRRSLGLSQKQLAEATGTSQQYIAKMEAGKQNISVNMLLTILESLQLDISLINK